MRTRPNKSLSQRRGAPLVRFAVHVSWPGADRLIVSCRMSASPEKALRLTFLFVMAVIVASLFIVPLMLGIWLPDVFVDREHTLAHERLASGHSLRVIQYWNHGDFYNTELVLEVKRLSEKNMAERERIEHSSTRKTSRQPF